MIRALATATAGALASVGLILVTPAPASAGCTIVQATQIINNQVVLVEQEVCEPSPVDPVGNASDTSEPPPPVGAAACIAGALLIGLDPVEYCSGDEVDDEVPTITGGLVAEALRRLDLPPSELVIQPPGGRTLVNFQTNFFTTNDQPFTRTIRLLGRPVLLRIWPESYTWRFGDGGEVTTITPGSRFPDLEITHNYLAKGKYRPTLATTYSAEWRVGRGPWLAVQGSATIAGAPAVLRAVEATPTLVGY